MSEYHSEAISDSLNLDLYIFPSEFVPGEHKIKLSAMYTTVHDQVRHLQRWITVNFPQPWSAKAKMITIDGRIFLNLNLFPSIVDPLQLKSIIIEEGKSARPFQHTIHRSLVPVPFSAAIEKVPKSVTIDFEPPLNGSNSYKLPLVIVQDKKFNAYCEPLRSIQTAILGEAVRMIASVNVEDPVQFNIDHDTECWMVSGPCSGMIRVKSNLIYIHPKLYCF